NAISEKYKRTNVIIINVKKIIYKIRAVDDNLETSLPNVGPVISAFMICTEEDSAFGKIAKANTKTPIPPTKWLKLRQNNIECDSTSTSNKILAPVVVKPLAISKKASTKDGICLLITNGKALKNEIAIQDSETIVKPSLA